MDSKIKSALFGVAIGDALGVPVEFTSREQRRREPVDDMWSYGTHDQPAGTFSDDASLTFCLAEALSIEFDLNVIAQNFIKWYYHAYWTAHGEVFDIGIATRQAIDRLAKGEQPEFAGGFEISSNGNGSLMRLLPLLFYIKDKSTEERYTITKLVSSITHSHIRSVISCFYYLEFARHLLNGNDLTYIYGLLKIEISDFLKSKEINKDEIAIFDRLFKRDIYKLNEDEIQSTGYVIHTLEASLWCLMTTTSYKEAVLKAVNLGDDTDTTAAVTGGLAGLLYGYENIPKQWLSKLARHNDIEILAQRMNKRLIMQNSDFIAVLKYKTTEEGGRETAAKSGYRPAVKFSFDKMLTSGIQTFIDKEQIYPGESVEAYMKILSAPHFYGRLEERMEFIFTEGDHIIGTGVIKEILNQYLKVKEIIK
ncbi:ADP-ribosylglycohydrolase family protein [Flavobacterium cerinum]|uniref:ADP-ribosylglycohydrolase family protein n=1 Tax=Flavobacterium cerinum TaxID=2502784 RepID=A0A3S4T2G7_9FLAO|nr:ADP-ribosylglycohydrolase family protein [Flavobacterium cerinum]RWX01571.1 ADP-ribosylglycohydrolase family protein [Flavobacterium cerinum]